MRPPNFLTSSVAPTISMLTFLSHIALKLALASVLWLPSGGGEAVVEMTFLLQESQEMLRAEREYQSALRERQAQLDDFRRLEREYASLIEQIERLKKTQKGGLQNRLQLEGALRKSRAIAEDMQRMHRDLQRIDHRLASYRAQLVEAIDRRIGFFEQSIPSSTPQVRQSIVEDLNRLRAARSRYTQPLPRVPTPQALMQSMQLAGEASPDDPEELLAAADELRDAEDQLRRRIGAVDSRLDELKRAQALYRRARSFTREEQFFEETDRVNQNLARLERANRSRQDSDNNSEDAEAPPVTSPTGESDLPNEEGGGTRGRNPAPSEDGFVADGPEPNISDQSGGAGSESPPQVQEPGERPILPPAGYEPRGPQDGEGILIIERQADPTIATRAPQSMGVSGVDGEIEGLKRERERLRRQAEKLREQAKNLQDRARRLR